MPTAIINSIIVENIKPQITRFVQCLFEPNDIIEVRRLPSGVSSWHKAQELVWQCTSLVAENETGQHIYIGANPRRSVGGTKADDVLLARCLFVDFDNVTIDEVEKILKDADFLEPTLIMNSGHGVHCYWRLTKPITVMGAWTIYQKRLIATLESDKTIHDPPRIMRLPGFMNHKEPPAPCSIVRGNPTRRYMLCDVEENLFVLAPDTPAQTVNTATTNKTTLTKIGRAALYAAKWPPVDKGSRNPEAYRHAATLRKDFALSESDAWPIIDRWNSTNNPPLN